jgi:hypothetical protein
MQQSPWFETEINEACRRKVDCMAAALCFGVLGELWTQQKWS